MEEKEEKMKDSLKVIQNEDGSFALEWDNDDPKWKWLNELTTEQITRLIESAVRSGRTGSTLVQFTN